MRKEFNKLVRDKIPEIVFNKGGYPEYEVLDDESYVEALNNKLLEECKEVLSATSRNDKIEEIADLLEVFMAISKLIDVDFDIIDKVR